MQNTENNLNQTQGRINQAAELYHRQLSDICLLAVSKRKPTEDIREAYRCGQRDFGENYLQEAQQKIQDLADLDICWHFIGAIQSNKTKVIAENFDWVHCVDRLKIAQRLSEQRPNSLPPLNICIQVNVDLEDTKAGIALEELPALSQKISQLPNIRLRGLMTIPAPSDSVESQRKPFAKLRKAFEELQNNAIECDTLSMGMSHDIEAAIAEGSTLVRIGTAIFGERI
ncbi:MAG: pyridoxal phosphate enzyme (YggS family) [Gammaproteobacteria bacterium]|jgi:pyridoxal phosphate enzyme (YggS family)